MSILEEMKKHGEYAQLSDGKVRYEIGGPEDGEKVVLVHGLMGHFHIWDYQFKFLVEHGFRVLRYDLYGRGFSERVKAQHDARLFMSQLKDLLKHVKFNSPFHLVGLSMGGAISTRYTSHHPELVKSLFLVDCYGIPTPNDPFIKLVQPKGIGEAFLGILGPPILKRAPIKAVFDKKRHKGFAKWFSALTVIKRSKRALLSTFRNFMLENHVPHYERINKLDIPKMILWGREDAVLPFSYGQKIHALVPSAKFEVFEKCGHVPQFEEADKFNQLSLKFFQENS
ncbi:MAG: pimeloyl-ACP methyl ester carboxylesterase [Bacteroidia bacterium]|jgi:pimeloyl-ACP methyl ester carboxylesterase